MKSIIIVTLAAPLLSGCNLLTLTAGAPATQPVRPPLAATPAEPARTPSSDIMHLRSAPVLEAAPQLEREEPRADTGIGNADFRRDQARALGGDKDAAMRVARMFGDGTGGVPRDERRMVLWLKHASLLEHAGASYQLYLYYLARGLDRDALRYERRAVRQGYVIPLRLDNRRG